MIRERRVWPFIFVIEDGITMVSAEYEWVALRRIFSALFNISPVKTKDIPDISIAFLGLTYTFSSRSV